MRLLRSVIIFILLLFSFMAFAQKPVKKPTDKPVIEYYMPAEDIYPVEVQIYRDTLIYRVLTLDEGQRVLDDPNTIWLHPIDTIWRYKEPIIPLDSPAVIIDPGFFNNYKFLKE